MKMGRCWTHQSPEVIVLCDAESRASFGRLICSLHHSNVLLNNNVNDSRLAREAAEQAPEAVTKNCADPWRSGQQPKSHLVHKSNICLLVGLQAFNMTA